MLQSAIKDEPFETTDIKRAALRVPIVRRRQDDSICAPHEAPRPNPDYPDWLGYDAAIQRLVR